MTTTTTKTTTSGGRMNGFNNLLVRIGKAVGGVVGTFLIGLLAAEVVSGGVEGLLYGGGMSLLGKQTLAIPVVALYAFVVSFLIGKIIDVTFGFRIQREDEISGIDLAQHAETAYTEGVHGAPQKRPGLS